MAGLFQRIAQNYRKKKKITQPSARLNAKEDKTEHAGNVVRAKERIHSKVEKEDFLLSQIDGESKTVTEFIDIQGKQGAGTAEPCE